MPSKARRVIIRNKSGGPKRKTQKSKAKATYYVHDNGGRPFKVEDYGNKVSVYKMDYDVRDDDLTEKEKKESYSHIFDKSYKTIFVGTDRGKAYHKGNSILLQLAKGHYMFIGWNIYEFHTVDNEDIDKYYSPVGNSDVPYPYAAGKNNTYILIEYAIVSNDLLDLKRDAYQQYYFEGLRDEKKYSKLKYKLVHKRIF
jgi:hypothetical protein